MMARVQLGLEGLGVLVTGGAGGIGAATVRAFAAEGARVAVHYRTGADAAEALAKEADGVALRADLRVEAEADRLVPAAVEALGRVDICVANAGVFDETPTPIWESSLERFRAGIEGNLVATWLTCRAFLRHVRETGEGSLVLVGSTSGIFGEAGHAEYASAKAAINMGLARTLKNEIVRIAPRGRVNVVAPGWTATPMVAGTLDDATIDRVTRTYALRKVATPEEVASAIVWVASPAAGHTTGEIIPVSGGMEGRLLW
jgi:3-oxoacyl-[acyl-carrier protein] reductase